MSKNNRLRIILAERKIRQNEFAKRLGITQSTLSDIVNEKREPTLSTALRIARALNCEIGDIWSLDD